MTFISLKRKVLMPFLTILLIALFSMCSEKDELENTVPDNSNPPYFGFNAKGTLDIPQQTDYANSFFNQIPSNLKSNLAIRVTGGSLSQKTYLSDWTDELIQAWVALQNSHNLRFIYVVNGNDTPGNQRIIIKKWLDAGAQFDFIEMMNEYYLNKYAIGDTSYYEVTEAVSPEKYIDTILPAFWSELDQFELPYYIICAPTATSNAGEYREHWNDVILDAVVNKYPSRNLNITVHLYFRANSTEFDYEQINSLRSRLPDGSNIAITEAGILDPSLTYHDAGIKATEHYRTILQSLQSGDYLLDQILYNGSENNNTATLNPYYNGETPKGTEMLHFILNGLN